MKDSLINAVVAIIAMLLIFGAGVFAIQALAEQKIENRKQSANDIATEKILDLATTATWSHTSSNGADFKARVLSVASSGTYGEVLYKGTCNKDFAIEKWKQSPTHNDIISDTSYKGFVERVGYYNETDCYIVRIYYK